MCILASLGLVEDDWIGPISVKGRVTQLGGLADECIIHVCPRRSCRSVQTFSQYRPVPANKMQINLGPDFPEMPEKVADKREVVGIDLPDSVRLVEALIVSSHSKVIMSRSAVCTVVLS
jgi:hypothetical protein